MLRYENSEDETQTTLPNIPASRGDLITDAPVENYLNQYFAPLIGTMSYDERQLLRAQMRQEIQSVVAAHVELGSTREQAIALVLRSRQAPSIGTAVRPVPVSHKSGIRPTGARHSLPTALRAFGMSALASLVVMLFAMNARDGTATEGVILAGLMLGVFPFLAGASLGAKNTDRPLRGLLQAQLLLYAPLTLALSLTVDGGRSFLSNQLLIATAIYTASSALFGSAGVYAGGRLKRRAQRRRKKANSLQ